jgi:GST-like protein
MSHWRPGRAWFEANAPRLIAIARRAAQEPRFDATWRRNFPKDYPA